YGCTVVYNDNRVFMNGVDVASAGQYAEQAIDLASAGRDVKTPERDEWQPLGVFGMVQGEEKVAQHLFQLAVDRKGVVRGNYYDALTDQTTPVYGSVDRKSQRVCWSVGKKKDIVFEAGLHNLTQKQSTALVHYGKERTVQMVLVRLEEPRGSKK